MRIAKWPLPEKNAAGAGDATFRSGEQEVEAGIFLALRHAPAQLRLRSLFLCCHLAAPLKLQRSQTPFRLEHDAIVEQAVGRVGILGSAAGGQQLEPRTQAGESRVCSWRRRSAGAQIEIRRQAAPGFRRRYRRRFAIAWSRAIRVKQHQYCGGDDKGNGGFGWHDKVAKL